jgi:voltage-gated potassium channel
MIFSNGLYLAEQSSDHPTLSTLGDALYWGVAALSTAGIADIPHAELAKLIGGIWIIVGSFLFFGAIVATITGYFMRPMQRPHNQIIDTIEYNLEQFNDLSREELARLKETVDTLIVYVEQLNEKHHQR